MQTPEQNLWRGVLLQLMRDLASGDTNDRTDAEKYIDRFPSRSFRKVCELADVQPRETHAAMVDLISRSIGERRAWLKILNDQPENRVVAA